MFLNINKLLWSTKNKTASEYKSIWYFKNVIIEINLYHFLCSKNCCSLIEIFRMNYFFALNSLFITLIFELFWGSCEHREWIKVHRNDSVRSWQEILYAISCFPWSHTQAVTNWKNCNIWLIKFVDQFHIWKNICITSMIYSKIMIWNCHDKSACCSSCYLYTLRSNTCWWVVCCNHCNFTESEIFCSSFLHFCNKWWRNFSEKFIISSNFRCTYNFPFFFLSCHDKEWCMHWMI